MGTSLVTNQQKTEWNNVFNDIQATFGRPIVIFKTAVETVIYSNPNHNFLFDGDVPFNTETEKIVQSGIFLARIKYGSRENLTPFNSVVTNKTEDQNIIRLKEGEVRIKLDPTGSAFLNGCERVTFDGTIFNVETDKRPHGLFEPNFDTFYLKKIQ